MIQSFSDLLEFFLLGDSLSFVVLCDVAVCGVSVHLLASLTCSVVEFFRVFTPEWLVIVSSTSWYESAGCR